MDSNETNKAAQQRRAEMVSTTDHARIEFPHVNHSHRRGAHERSLPPGTGISHKQPPRHTDHVRRVVQNNRATCVRGRPRRAFAAAMLPDVRWLTVPRTGMEAFQDGLHSLDHRERRNLRIRETRIQAQRLSHANHLRSALSAAPQSHGPAGNAGSLWVAQSDAWLSWLIDASETVSGRSKNWAAGDQRDAGARH